METKAFNKEYHKERIVEYVLQSWISGYEMDCDRWTDNHGIPIMIIHLSQDEKSIVIKNKDFTEIIIPEVERRFNTFKKGFSL